MSSSADRPLDVAVTSWLTPGTAAYNADFLAARPALEADGCRVAEMGICCFALADSLSYARTDWPAPGAPFAFHLHLPVDLPWGDAAEPPGRRAGQGAAALMGLLADLGVRRAVLHPPSGPGALEQLRGFLAVWRGAGLAEDALLLENVRDLDRGLWETLLADSRVSVCLDVAHLIAYDQARLLTFLPVERVRLTHWSAPGTVPGVDAHGPLTGLTPAQYAIGRGVARRFPAALPLLEVFSWEDARRSMPVLRALYQAEGDACLPSVRPAPAVRKPCSIC